MLLKQLCPSGLVEFLDVRFVYTISPFSRVFVSRSVKHNLFSHFLFLFTYYVLSASTRVVSVSEALVVCQEPCIIISSVSNVVILIYLAKPFIGLFDGTFTRV